MYSTVVCSKWSHHPHSYMHLIASSASGLEAGAIVLVMLHRPELLFAFVTLAREAGEHHWPKNRQA